MYEKVILDKELRKEYGEKSKKKSEKIEIKSIMREMEKII